MHQIHQTGKKTFSYPIMLMFSQNHKTNSVREIRHRIKDITLMICTAYDKVIEIVIDHTDLRNQTLTTMSRGKHTTSIKSSSHSIIIIISSINRITVPIIYANKIKRTMQT